MPIQILLEFILGKCNFVSCTVTKFEILKTKKLICKKLIIDEKKVRLKYNYFYYIDWQNNICFFFQRCTSFVLLELLKFSELIYNSLEFSKPTSQFFVCRSIQFYLKFSELFIILRIFLFLYQNSYLINLFLQVVDFSSRLI